MSSFLPFLDNFLSGLRLYSGESRNDDQTPILDHVPNSYSSLRQEPLNVSASLRGYGFAGVVVVFCTLGGFVLFPFVERTNLVMLYLLGVLVVSAKGHRGPAGLVSVLSVLCFDLFFVPPRFTFSVEDVQYVWTFIVMLITAMTISRLTIRFRREAESARQAQRRTVAMHTFAQRLTGAQGFENVLETAVSDVAQIFDGTAAVFLPDNEGVLDLTVCFGDFPVGDKIRGVVRWVFDSGQPAGWGTSSVPDVDALYVPLRGEGVPIGVLGVKPGVIDLFTTPEQKLLLDSLAHQIGLSMNLHRLARQTRKAEVDVETERTRSALLSSVSHDFRTPLTAIVGSASALLEKPGFPKDSPDRELLETIQDEALRLSRLVHNLLEATRLEGGTVRIRSELYPLEEVIGGALDRLEKPLGLRPVAVSIPENLFPVVMDGILMEQVFVNLLENAIRHTPPHGGVDVSVTEEKDGVLIAVSDQGPGLKEDEKERVFDKFYHGKSSPGAGLGLSICRAIVNAHGGRIWAENRPGGGAVFFISLPTGQTRE